MKKINSTAFINYTASSFYNELNSAHINQYQKLEQEKELGKKWISKFNSCNTCRDFIKTIHNFEMEISSKMSRDDIEFYVFNVIAFDKEKASDIIMQCLNAERMHTASINAILYTERMWFGWQGLQMFLRV